MEYTYSCPYCKSILNVENRIIFLIETSKKHKKGLLLLNPHLGEYNYVSHPTITFEEGEKVEFICPVCHKNLTASEINSKLVHVNMVDSDNKDYHIYFSKIAGEHLTFMSNEDHIIEKYGKHSSRYMDYFVSKLDKIKK